MIYFSNQDDATYEALDCIDFATKKEDRKEDINGVTKERETGTKKMNKKDNSAISSAKKYAF